ncbi:transglycosylase-like protein with SLT domain [Sulfuritortus calidifontis]|uniref:Transglycosylase-like protein with SLT domain n=1 Tax=Sulfuritortus calidifontis TaxID=1914471 RepID=A0A4V2UR26_9PROT|nr:lytic transglycosylase domain-containing protein [Sulfuritortus calidifontis]TCS73446.1 transglycosylase-like protein with SLT domain [Sulfuritortus calidifontis]
MSKDGIRALILALGLTAGAALAGAQKYEPLSDSVKAQLSKTVADSAVEAAFADAPEVQAWLSVLSQRLARFIPDAEYRRDFLETVHYEATRAGLDPELVLGLIEVESGFRKYAVSSASARGYMQVMPFWVDLIGSREQNLFHLRTNLRYGCTILRHYLDIERGDLFRALGRYNGSLGQAQYPNAVYAAWRKRWTTGVLPASFQPAPRPIKKGG